MYRAVGSASLLCDQIEFLDPRPQDQEIFLRFYNFIGFISWFLRKWGPVCENWSQGSGLLWLDTSSGPKWSGFDPQCFYSLVLQSCFLFKNKNMKREREEKKQHGSTRSITIWCSICMNNLLLKNCFKHVHHSDLLVAFFDLNSQHGSTHHVTI